MTKQLTGNCQHCGGLLQFPAEQTGETASCPHCHEQTELMLAAPPEEVSPLRTRAIVFITLALVILILGVVGAQLAIKRAKRMTGQNGKPAPRVAASSQDDPIAQAGFQVSTVALEKAPNSSLVYAVGKVIEVANRKRFGVRVELALFDREGKACGTAQDYSATLDAGATWQFRALVVNSQAARAHVSRVTEEK